MKHVVGISGGKDSTALALWLAENEPRDYEYVITPTGNELPPMIEHWRKLEGILGKPLTRITNNGHTLTSLIQIQNALPNHQMRWCTRMLKIEPLIAWIGRNSPALNYVGLRADEETREGIYGDKVQSRFPLREIGWGLKDVLRFLAEREIEIPVRTDCALCYHQRLGEWRDLWRDYPEEFAAGVAEEEKRGRTFRSAKRDTWPADLKSLGEQFASGRKIRGDGKQGTKCRVCSL